MPAAEVPNPNQPEKDLLEPALRKILMHAMGIHPEFIGQDTAEMLIEDDTTHNQKQAEEQAREELERVDEQVMHNVSVHGPAGQTSEQEAARVEADKSVAEEVEKVEKTVGKEKAGELSREAMETAAQQIHPEEATGNPGEKLTGPRKNVQEAFSYDSSNGETNRVVERAARDTAEALEAAGVKTNAKEVLEDMKPLLEHGGSNHVTSKDIEHAEAEEMGFRAVDSLTNNRRIDQRLVEHVEELDPSAQQNLAQVIALNREGRGVTARSARTVGHDLSHVA